METQSFANATLEGNFRYKIKETMLAYGSIIFGMSFLPSFPMFYFLDENENSRWNLSKVCAAGLSAGMIAIFLTDVCTHVIGEIPM
jgi:cycloeucalenol cycloisomerase